jgi:hypothetical protein
VVSGRVGDFGAIWIELCFTCELEWGFVGEVNGRAGVLPTSNPSLSEIWINSRGRVQLLRPPAFPPLLRWPAIISKIAVGVKRVDIAVIRLTRPVMISGRPALSAA